MGSPESIVSDAGNQAWLIERAFAIIEKKREPGIDVLTPHERLIHCLWTVDHCMRNAGDLATARARDLWCLTDARLAAMALGLPLAMEAFALSAGELERRYFELFDRLCDELRGR